MSVESPDVPLEVCVLLWRIAVLLLLMSVTRQESEEDVVVLAVSVILHDENPDVFGAVLQFIYVAGYQNPKTANNVAFHAGIFRDVDYNKDKGLSKPCNVQVLSDSRHHVYAATRGRLCLNQHTRLTVFQNGSYVFLVLGFRLQAEDFFVFLGWKIKSRRSLLSLESWWTVV